MSVDFFEPGRSFAGVLLTYDDSEQRTVPATLRFDAEKAVEIELSSSAVMGPSAFGEDAEHPSIWFRGDGHVPEQCIFQSLEGSITLSRLQNTRRSQNWVVNGVRFVAREAVLSATRASINEPVMFDELASQFDGLAEWWNERNIVVTRISDELGLAKRLEITSRDVQSIEWYQNGAQMRLELGWRSSTANQNRSWTLAQTTKLVSRFPGPRTADDHLDEHWKVRSLLVLLLGKALPYREHSIVSETAYFDELPSADDAPGPRYFPSRGFITRRTIRDYGEPKAEPSEFMDGIIYLSQIGAIGLERWADAWTPSWERLISPTVAMLGRPRPFIEDMILATGIFLDAWGKKSPKVEGERETYSQGSRANPNFATYVYRALIATGADWSTTSRSVGGLARAVREIYTAVKHAEKDQPDPTHMMLARTVMVLIVRMIAANQIDPSGELVRAFGAGHKMRQELQAFSSSNLIIDEAGQFVERSSGD